MWIGYYRHHTTNCTKRTLKLFCWWLTVVQAKDFRPGSRLYSDMRDWIEKAGCESRNFFLHKTQNVVIQLTSTAPHLLNYFWNGEKHTSQNDTIKIAVIYRLGIHLMACGLIWVFLWQLWKCTLKGRVDFRVHEMQHIWSLT